MHLHIISAVGEGPFFIENLEVSYKKKITGFCCVLLLTQGCTGEYKCGKNVPPSAREALFKVINEKCTNAGYKALSNEVSYSCDMEQKAFEGRPSGVPEPSDPYFFDGRSKFNFDWKESLSEAIKVADKERGDLPFPVRSMCYLSIKKLGCFIELSTFNDTGIHELKLRCNYGFVFA